MNKKTGMSLETIKNKIYLIRGQKVMVDSDLAKLYGVPTKRLNEQVKRNLSRFPDDFMFRLTQVEKDKVVAICDHLHNLKFSSHLPFAFTEHGALMLASILNSTRAIQMSLLVVRTFIQLRAMLASHKELALKINLLETKLNRHDTDIQTIISAIRQLMKPVAPQKRKKIGFHTGKEGREAPP